MWRSPKWAGQVGWPEGESFLGDGQVTEISCFQICSELGLGSGSGVALDSVPDFEGLWQQSTVREHVTETTSSCLGDKAKQDLILLEVRHTFTGKRLPFTA